jgi:uncharacterized SAM-binding protein YcdF (DUF218 family)
MRVGPLGCIGVAIAGLILLALHPLLLSAAGRQLVEADELRPADVIVVLAGNAPSRAEHAANLLREGWAPRLIVSDERVQSHGFSMTWSVLYARGLVTLDVPAEAIVLLPALAEDTHEEALLARSVMQQNGWRRAILVTDAFHSRRATLLFRAAFEPAGLEVRSSPAINGGVHLDRWWTNPDATEAVVSEYFKLGRSAVTGEL